MCTQNLFRQCGVFSRLRLYSYGSRDLLPAWSYPAQHPAQTALLVVNCHRQSYSEKDVATAPWASNKEHFGGRICTIETTACLMLFGSRQTAVGPGLLFSKSFSSASQSWNLDGNGTGNCPKICLSSWRTATMDPWGKRDNGTWSWGESSQAL